MAKKSITARWVLNTLCAIIFVLFCIIIVVSVLFKEQYYETVRVTLDSRATNVVSSYFSISNDSSITRLIFVLRNLSRTSAINPLWRVG